MRFIGQITLVTISLLFATYEKFFQHDTFFSFDLLICTIIAWTVGMFYDRLRFLVKETQYRELNYKNLLDSLPESIYIHRDSKLVYVNDAFVSMVGATSKEELIGLSLYQFVCEDYKERLIERVKIANREKKPLPPIEHRFKRLDGTPFYFEVSSMYILFGRRGALLSIGKDVTEKKIQTERMIQKSEKLAMLGQLAAGIAHEIRNPLTSIRGFMQLMQDNQLEEKYFPIILTELDRINSIVGEFLVLSKPTVVVYIEQDIKELLADVVILIQTQTILNNIQIHVELEEELPKFSCEKNQIKQVLLNLLKNSIEAMPTGGEIIVKVSEKEEGQLSISITDQGIGIPQDRIATLGEPFYTTKEKGTGLGLMTCYKIVEEHKGELRIHSKVNEGTTVEILLPTITQPLIKTEMMYK